MSYLFNKNDVYKFKEFINAKTIEKGNELIFEVCPFCSNGGHSDKEHKNKFSINLLNGTYHCKRESCDANSGGNMLSIYKYFKNEGFTLTFEDDSNYKKMNAGDFVKLKQHKRESTNIAIEYMKSRGISEEICRKYEITSKCYGEDGDECIVFVCRDENDVVQFCKYRPINPDGTTGKEICEANAKSILFGMNHCDGHERLIITEGQIDALSLAEANIKNAVAVTMGKNNSKWTEYCFDFVNSFNEIIVFGDNENGEITLVDMISKKFKHPIIKVVKTEDYCDLKDANDILRKYGTCQLKKAVDNAQEVPSKNWLSTKQIKISDKKNEERLPSGIDALDRVLGGGFRFGNYHVITGRTGEGKSTLASHIMASALCEGYSCAIYSGEMAPADVKTVLYSQVAGKDHLQKYQDNTRWHDEQYRVTEEVEEYFDNGFLNKLHIYNSLNLDSEDELDAVIEEGILKYNARVFLIDNLMTATDLLSVENAFDKNDEVSKFSKRLRKLALIKNIIIILVAHSKKGANTVGLEMDQISGTADVGNLCDVCISYGKCEKDADTNINEITGNNPYEFKRLLKIIKNRGNKGKLLLSGIEINCEKGSYRLYNENFNRDGLIASKKSWDPEYDNLLIWDGCPLYDFEKTEESI